MSDYERNKGKLIPVNVDTENFTDEDFEVYTENGYAVIGGEVYEVQWEIERDNDVPEFADVRVNEDGSIDFHTYHYNGGGYWTEVIEDALKDGEQNGGTDEGYGEVKQTMDGYTQSLFTMKGEAWVIEQLTSEGII